MENNYDLGYRAAALEVGYAGIAMLGVASAVYLCGWIVKASAGDTASSSRPASNPEAGGATSVHFGGTSRIPQRPLSSRSRRPMLRPASRRLNRARGHLRRASTSPTPAPSDAPIRVELHATEVVGAAPLGWLAPPLCSPSRPARFRANLVRLRVGNAGGLTVTQWRGTPAIDLKAK
jgi:hypothetical protein